MIVIPSEKSDYYKIKINKKGESHDCKANQRNRDSGGDPC